MPLEVQVNTLFVNDHQSQEHIKTIQQLNFEMKTVK